MNPLFVNEDNTTRILAMWDQTDRNSDDDSVPFGRSYSENDINIALNSDEPYSKVNFYDENGHGTYMAAIACGRDEKNESNGGMAPLSSLCVVKLKDAKKYLKEYYCVDDRIVCYQENDIMLAISYILRIADEYKMPAVICLGLGTNLGDHNGNGFLENYLDDISSRIGRAVCVSSGNEGDKSHHYAGVMEMDDAEQNVEVIVGDNTSGFTVQLWTQAPDTLSVGFTSPSGERYDKVPISIRDNTRIRFIIEKSIIDVDYWIAVQNSGDELIEMRFRTPAAGRWIIHVYNEGVISGRYDMWLPCEGMMNDRTFFLKPDPDITITEPGNARFSVTCGAYEYDTNAVWIESGRGYTRSGNIKPDICAPFSSDNPQIVLVGTSASAAYCAGAAALLQEWAFVRYNDLQMSGNILRKYMIRGAWRDNIRKYPNKEWGYGSLDVYGIFQNVYSRR